MATHITDLSQAWSKQVPQDVPSNPNITNGGVIIAYRDHFGSAVSVSNIAHQQPITQKRDKDDMEQLRAILSGIMKRPDARQPNADFHAQQQRMRPLPLGVHGR